MATSTLDKVSLDSNASASEIPMVERDSKLHTSPVSRVLAKVSKWAGDYADYEMENGVWRKLAI